MSDLATPTTDDRRYPRCILGTCCIPWREDDTFDEPLFRRLVRHTLARGTKHLYLFGTAGEGYAVTDAQFEHITRTFAEEMRAADAEPMIGLISPSLGQVRERIERGLGWGVREFQISLPSWGTCTPGETRRFFAETCGAFPQARFLHYNLRRSGRLVTPAEYVELAAAHPNLVAIKHTTDSTLELLTLAGLSLPCRLFLTEFGFTAGCLMGLEPGLLVSIASLQWPRARAFFEAGVTGDRDRLLGVAGELVGVLEALRATMGEAHMDGAFDQMFAKAGLPEFPLRLLPPYAAASAESFERFMATVRERFPKWS